MPGRGNSGTVHQLLGAALAALTPATSATTTATVAAASAAPTGTLTGSLGVGSKCGIRRKVLLAEFLSVADPNLDTKGTDLRIRDCECVVDVSTESVERSTSFLEHLAAGHFSAADTAADLDLDAFCTNPHRGSDGHLDGAPVGHAALDLAGDAVGDDRSVNFRALDLEDVDLDVFLRNLLELFLQTVDFLAALADDDTRTGSVDGDALTVILGKAGGIGKLLL